MQSFIKVAIVGRPNVGKSSLFNRLLRKRKSIVDEKEGVTRDRVYGEVECFGHDLKLIDTAGIDDRAIERSSLDRSLYEQTQVAIKEADIIVQVVDVRVGLQMQDRVVAKMIHDSKKASILAVNKVDNSQMEMDIYEFYALGFDNITSVSASSGHHVAELIEMIIEHAPDEKEMEDKQEAIKLAIIGRPNVGKSSFLNAILDENRAVVSDEAGTTRDAIDADLTIGDQHFTLIDTAGIKRKKKESDVIDKFAFMRTQKAIARSDCCVLMLDAQDGLTSQEKRLIDEVHSQQKPLLLFMNKWDIVHDYRMEHVAKALRSESAFIEHVPLIFGSVKQKRNLDKVFLAASKLVAKVNMEIKTSQLNQIIEDSLQYLHPPVIKGKRLRIYYATQVKRAPQELLMFVNHKDRLCASYERYLYKRICLALDLQGIPLKLNIVKKASRRSQSASEMIAEH